MVWEHSFKSSSSWGSFATNCWAPDSGFWGWNRCCHEDIKGNINSDTGVHQGDIPPPLRKHIPTKNPLKILPNDSWLKKLPSRCWWHFTGLVQQHSKPPELWVSTIQCSKKSYTPHEDSLCSVPPPLPDLFDSPGSPKCGQWLSFYLLSHDPGQWLDFHISQTPSMLRSSHPFHHFLYRRVYFNLLSVQFPSRLKPMILNLCDWFLHFSNALNLAQFQH